MKELIEMYKYTPGEYFNEWVKGTWTVRFGEEKIEAFDDFSNKAHNKYVVMPKDIESLRMLLDEIEKMAF
jgi:hypothetical protein